LKENGAKYPYVANIARKYLAIPATSAPSERVWRRLARILSLRRARLSDDLAGCMMYVKENLLFPLKTLMIIEEEGNVERLASFGGP
jgi:hypothetical protein